TTETTTQTTTFTSPTTTTSSATTTTTTTQTVTATSTVTSPTTATVTSTATTTVTSTTTLTSTGSGLIPSKTSVSCNPSTVVTDFVPQAARRSFSMSSATTTKEIHQVRSAAHPLYHLLLSSLLGFRSQVQLHF